MTRLLPDHLAAGYAAFREGRFLRESDRFRRLAAEGQRPRTMVIACCDSRSAPETLFDTGPGEIFVVRNVANLVPPHGAQSGLESTAAALEFALNGLKVEHILVLGHRHCGGIGAALAIDAEPLSPDDYIGKWTALLDETVREVTDDPAIAEADRNRALEYAGVRRSLANLRTYPDVQAMEARGALSLHGGWVEIATASLWVLDETTGTFHDQATIAN